MGAGDFPAGIGPAGFDPAAAYQALAPAQPPLAAQFDPSSKTFVFLKDGTGRLAAIHPVDQAVTLALCSSQGTIASVPDLGTTFDRLKRGSVASIQRECEMIVDRALDRLITANDIELRSVEVTRPIPGRVLVVVTYYNLRLADRATRSAGFGF